MHKVTRQTGHLVVWPSKIRSVLYEVLGDKSRPHRYNLNYADEQSIEMRAC